MPYDDCPLLPVSEDDPSTTNASSTPLLLSSSAAHTSSAGDLGRGNVGGGSFFGTVPNAGAAADGGGLLRGGDVVRLCHLTSKGFLTHDSVLPPARRKVGGLGPTGRGDDGGEGEGVAKKEVRAACCFFPGACSWVFYCGVRSGVSGDFGVDDLLCRRRKGRIVMCG